MRLVDGTPILSASDLASFLECEHVLSLERLVAAGELKRPHFPDPALELLTQRGVEHEQRHLETLRGRLCGEVVEIALRPPRDVASWERAASDTRAAMVAGVAIIYQGTFLDEGWLGRADFLVRVETPSSLGNWSYEVVDTKLVTQTKARAIIQLCVYSELLARMQGRLPDHTRIVLGGVGGEETHRVADYQAYVRALRRRMLARFAPDAGATYPDPVDHCGVCDFRTICDGQWRRDDHLSLVAGISRRQRDRLADAGVRTLTALGTLPLPVASPTKIDIGKPALLRIREQARLQGQGRWEGRTVHELIRPVEADCGLATLPPPSPGDLYFDIEGDPYAVEGGIDYLLGLVEPPAAPGAELHFHGRWAFNLADERKQFEAFMDLVIARLDRHPDMHIYHYAPYEPTALKRMMGRHGTREAEVDRLLRGGVLVDLYRVVRQGIRASVESYSIKQLEPLYGFQRAVPLATARKSLQRFAEHLSAGVAGQTDRVILDEVEGYNRDDCVSAFYLHRWLEEQRAELEKPTGEPLPRPKSRESDPSEEAAEQDAELQALKARLTRDIPDDPALRSPGQTARWLLAQMVEWHRREDKSFWWDYFHHTELTDEEHLEDGSSLGGLEHVGIVGKVKRSHVHRYRFPPQEHAIRVGRDVRDARTQESPGEVVSLDEQAHTVDLKRGTGSKVAHPTAIIPFEHVNAAEQRASLRRIAAWVAEHGIDADGPYRAARDLLLRRRPRLRSAASTNHEPLALPAEDAVTAACRLVGQLEDSVLAIQGPPGSGKTYTGSRLIAALLAAGKKVGITANSHKVICNLLEPTVSAARALGVHVQAVQKVTDQGDGCEDPGVTLARNNDDVLEAIDSGQANLIAGTAWLWSREDMAGKVDVLVVDEAGQIALANALAVSPAAGSLVLLGDPQQLNQPTKGVHPPGAAGSALEHLLAGAPTIASETGLLLPTTRRLHPEICRFTSESFYEGKLQPRPGLERQTVVAPGRLTGSGLRYVPVVHHGNEGESPEEVDAIARLYADLTSGQATWIDENGESHRMTADDVLVVAPYNAQVAALRDRLGNSASVGTVDKFQGQEAQVVICSMTTSTAEDAPRGMEFLYSPNRLNVATSRARCLTVLVANPALFQPRCRNPRQIRLANAFCRFLELATVVELPGDVRDVSVAASDEVAYPMSISGGTEALDGPR